MKTPHKIQELFHHQSEFARDTIARNVGQFYVRVYDCMLVLRMFI
ncbi:hypothetical protein [Flavobacterium sp.]|nr:hypothetical protein [Flavobacterium sp.]